MCFYYSQCSWQGEIRDESIDFPPISKAIVDYQDPAKADKASLSYIS